MLTHGSELWAVCKRNQSKIRAAEIKFMRRAGCSHLDYEKEFRHN